MIRCITLLSLIWLPAVALADDPLIAEATAQQTGGSWRISVTLTHPDSGWDHYADGWRVLDTKGNVLGLRELAHPHVNEQPFTRSLAGVAIPEGLDTVLIQARCNVDGWSEATYVLPLACSSC
ncbi:hypothetical protein PhaeoP18_02732 [Phaeobacter piscinae]|uniref:Secreted protein n=1 Tax=Phaeobacter piscinae TaxID=1580596 RepID=A0AAN1GT64_9RHOB|nr:hypothetical protein [Phaeobacter piscinae]ATG44660.1 hypothetical protein PhaeoP13_02753 [Phaeobacter piscinae]AUR36974.1 hypothetical protein PhaeoP18_02732 [Phaeobacter piscinae]